MPGTSAPTMSKVKKHRGRGAPQGHHTRPVLHPQDVDELCLNGVTHKERYNDEDSATALAGAVRLTRRFTEIHRERRRFPRWGQRVIQECQSQDEAWQQTIDCPRKSGGNKLLPPDEEEGSAHPNLRSVYA